MYDELVKRLKEDKSWVEQGTTQTEHEIAEHIQQAADAIEELTGLVQEAERDRDEYRERLDKANDDIEELLDFAHFVASNVVVSDEEWDNNMLVFQEVASRKLNKLGIVKKDGAFWSYEPPKEE